MICAHCGCENPNGIAYCRDCGMSLRATPARVAAPTPTPELAGIAPPESPSPSPLQQTQIATLRSEHVAPVAPGTDPPCARCGERNPEGSRFCHSCGLPLAAPAPAAATAPVAAPPAPVSVVCSRCRGVADPGADFCKFCGARLGAAEPPSSHRQVAPAPPAAPIAANPPAVAFAHAPAGPMPVSPGMPPVAPLAPSPIAQVGAPSTDPHGAPDQLTRPLHGIGDVAVRARLVRIAKDGSEGAHHAITGEVTDIGRSEGGIVLADDPYLSPRHARIVVRNGSDPTKPPSLVLQDLGSVNGVFVRLRVPHPLVQGDLLLLGQQVLRFEAVTEIEGARGPAMQHGVLLFGSPAPVSRGRLVQRTVEGLARDVFYLVRDEFVLGRESGDRVFPEDVFMSRRHAAIRREGSGFILQDLGSSNGTFVQIHGEHVLTDGDQFRIGHHLFRVDVPAPSGTA